MNSKSSIDSLEPLNLRTTPAIIADALRAQIISGAFRPGERIAEPKIAERLGVSRGPVREALQRLVQEGLVINVINKGVCVVELSGDDIVDIYRARRAVEREAALILFERKPEKEFRRLDMIVDAMARTENSKDAREIVEKDLNFHRTLVDAAQSLRLSRMFSTLLAECQLSMAQLKYLDPNPVALAERHREIVRDLRRNDLPKLLAGLDAHLDAVIRELSGKRRTRT